MTHPENAAHEPERAEEFEKLAEQLQYPSRRAAAKGGIMGALIGLAVIVPGISGSTIAIIFKLYDKLLFAVGNLFRRFKQCIRFLLPIAVGLIVGVIAGFFSVKYLLELQPFAVISLFAGLMAGALPAVFGPIRSTRPTAKRGGLFAAGLLLPVAVSVISVLISAKTHSFENLRFYHYLLFLLLGYIVAITQLVPGLSASAMLMMFGYFRPLLDSVSLTYWQSNPMVFLVYACLAAGFLLGLFTFSKFLSKISQNYKTPFYYTLAGLSCGSVVTMFYNPDIVPVYGQWAGGGFAAELCLGIVLFLAGALVSFVLVCFEQKKENRR